MKSQCALITISSLILFLAVSTNSQPYPPGSCGIQAGGTLCAPGFCCSTWGFCGNTGDYCDPDKCQSQCPPPPPPPPPPGPILCGIQHGGATCPPAMCCSVEGHCSNSRGPLCSREYCQSQCGGSPTCGVDAGGAMPCIINECCTKGGFCAPLQGASCRPPFCQSQCLFGQGDEAIISMIEEAIA